MEPRDANGETTRKTAALPGFVSTTLLTSSDGLFGDNVEEKRLSEAPAPRAQDADYKPLYDRLQEMKDQKDKDWKEKNNPFAPPKALDDDEIEFIRDLENRQADSEKTRKAQQQDDLVEFMLARESAKSSSATGTTVAPVAVAKPTTLSDAALKKLQEKKPVAAPAVIIKAKRKQQEKPADSAVDAKKKKVQSTVKITANVGLGGLVGYGSDSDSDSDGR